MNVVVNGQPAAVPDGITVATLLELNSLADRACAVEVNRQLVPRREHENHVIQDGDRVELVTLVGGG
ncbi:MAG: sulfur carrier protein ThiS [Phycisphaerales bacterium]|nr:sulfur carrier protein ThiS [Phycisphaerales bacterium]